MKWAVGVTTVPERICMMLPRTIDSLRRGGFESPRLFVDGAKDIREYEHFGLECTLRWPRIRAWGNWWLAFNELFIRQPHADRYALFQDDILTVRNLRQYLEATEYPHRAYLNCAIYPQNHEPGRKGWYKAPSGKNGWRGFGAQGLIFDRQAMFTLIGEKLDDFTHKPTAIPTQQAPGGKAYESIDGAVVSKLETFGIMEHVHGPSLITHIGDVSAIGHSRQPDIVGFPGEDFDAMMLL